MKPNRKNIESRAYDLYRERNGKDGTSIDDWLKAEKNAKKENAERAKFRTKYYKQKMNKRLGAKQP